MTSQSVARAAVREHLNPILGALTYRQMKKLHEHITALSALLKDHRCAPMPRERRAKIKKVFADRRATRLFRVSQDGAEAYVVGVSRMAAIMNIKPSSLTSQISFGKGAIVRKSGIVIEMTDTYADAPDTSPLPNSLHALLTPSPRSKFDALPPPL